MRRIRAELPVAPRLIASSVVRGAQLSESHGGLCIVDFAAGSIDCVLDWNSTEIDVAGRGGDRGLRGIGIVDDNVYVLSSTALLLFDRDMRLQRRFENRYLKHCHELSIYEGKAYIASTGFDAVLIFDLAAERFVGALHLRMDGERMRLLAFDPGSSRGPASANDFHLNSVKCDSNGLFIAGLRSAGLLCVSGSKLSRAAPLPPGTHNAQPFQGGVIYNDTANDRLCARFDGRELAIPVSVDPAVELDWVHAEDQALARPFFARGLCPLSSRYVAAGSSPSTITLYDLEAQEAIAQATLSADVRNAIHGLTVWPFQGYTAA